MVPILRRAVMLLAAAGTPNMAAAQARPRTASQELQTLSSFLNHVRLSYADSVGYHEMVTAAIWGVLRSLDPHSYYVTQGDWDRLSLLERGGLGTVGVALEEVDGASTVLAVAPRSPAAKAGALPGDRVRAINDTTVAGLDVKAVTLRLAGPSGTKVKVRFERGPRLDPDTFATTLKREIIERLAVSVVRMIDTATGYLRLEEFQGDASSEVRDALKKLRRQRARQVILDLRGNPGGSVTAAVETAAEFLPRGAVVFRTRGRKRDIDTTFITKRDGDFRSIPLVVLIDESSASASEALAGSLQDHDRALIVGRRSFGKALMQTVFLLPFGDNVWLTVGRVLTPNGRFIQRRYRGIGYQQYLSFAGKSGADEDTTVVYRTDAGRPVRAGGGIAPDVAVAGPLALPVWWSAAADSGLDHAVADSVAYTLGADAAARARWLSNVAEWRARLVPPFLSRVRSRLQLEARPDSAVESRIAAILAARSAEVRWGPDAREDFIALNDPDIQTALAHFPRLATLLAAPAR